MLLSVNMDRRYDPEKERKHNQIRQNNLIELSNNLDYGPNRVKFVEKIIELMSLIQPDHKIEDSSYHSPKQMLERITPDIEKYIDDIEVIGESQLVIYCFDGQHRLLFCTDSDFPDKNGLTLGHSDRPDPEVQKRFDALNLAEDNLKSSTNS